MRCHASPPSSTGRLAEGRREAANPVLPRLHNCRKGYRQPRPLSHEEVELCWKLLRDRGDACVRLAFAIGLESGLRAGEICRLEISDIDPVQQRIRVGLPTKTMRERTAFFGERTRECLTAWMHERSHHCGHRKLLHRPSGRPFTVASLHDALARVVCKTFKGKQLHDIGLERWHTHRLRHTMATNLVNAGANTATTMAAGGWTDYQAMCSYAAVDPRVSQRGYEDAMRRAQEQKMAAPSSIRLSPDEYLKRRQLTVVKQKLADNRLTEVNRATGASEGQSIDCV